MCAKGVDSRVRQTGTALIRSISRSDPSPFQPPTKQTELRSPTRSGEFVSVPVVKALQQIRRVGGGTQSHLMRCSDGGYYVVKFQNNPQGKRVLFNELLAAYIGRWMNLPVPRFSVVSVSYALVMNAEELVMQLHHSQTPCQQGLCFGSRHVGDLGEGELQSTLDLLPEGEEPLVENRRIFVGMLVFDKWLCNTDPRQVVFARNPISCRLSAHMIDNGLCFGGPEWRFDDAPLRGVFHRYAIYNFTRGFDEFDPWLDCIYRIDLISLRALANAVPTAWRGDDCESLARLLYRLDRRRKRLRELLTVSYTQIQRGITRVSQASRKLPRPWSLAANF